MAGINTLFIVEQALIIMALVLIVARQVPGFDFPTAVLVTCGIVAGNVVLAAMLFEHIGPFVAVPVFFLTCLLVVKFCRVSWPKGLLVTLLYFAIFAGVEIGKDFYRNGRITWNFEIPGKKNPEPVGDENASKENPDAAKKTDANATHATAGAADPIVAKDTNAPGNSTAATGTGAQAATPPPAATPANPSAPAAPMDRADWKMARSMLHIRGSMTGANGVRVATVNGQLVPVGGTTFVDYDGLRYTWRLTALDGYQPTWEPVSAAAIPPQK